MSTSGLLAALMALLQSPGVVTKSARLLKEHGTTEYGRDPVTREVLNPVIKIDPRNNALVTTTVHELLHLYMAMKHNVDRDFSDPLEEGMVEGMSKVLTSYLHKPKNEKLLSKWVAAIDEKLGR